MTREAIDCLAMSEEAAWAALPADGGCKSRGAPQQRMVGKRERFGNLAALRRCLESKIGVSTKGVSMKRSSFPNF